MNNSAIRRDYNPYSTDEPATDHPSGYPGVSSHHKDLALWASEALTVPSFPTSWTASADDWTSPPSTLSDASMMATASYGFSPAISSHFDKTGASLDFQSASYSAPTDTFAADYQALQDPGYHSHYSISTAQREEMTDAYGVFPIPSEVAWPDNPEETQADRPKRKRGRPRLYNDDGSRESNPMDSTTSTTSTPSGGPDADEQLGRASDKAAEQDSQTQAGDEINRQVLRSRNRAAATRYRNKMTATAESLEAQVQELSSRRASLSASAGQLRDELYQLKTEVFNHSDCHDPMIQGYLAGAAQQMYISLTDNETGWSEEHAGTASAIAEDERLC